MQAINHTSTTSENFKGATMERFEQGENVLELAVWGITANVVTSNGTTAGLERLMKEFKSKFNKVEKITNQVHRESECKAMYKCGFRFNGINNIHRTLYNLDQIGSIKMIWKI